VAKPLVVEAVDQEHLIATRGFLVLFYRAALPLSRKTVNYVPLLTPYRGRNKPTSQKHANRAHAQHRAPGERANAQLKTWHILRKLRCCPWQATSPKPSTSCKPAKSADEKAQCMPLAVRASPGSRGRTPAGPGPADSTPVVGSLDPGDDRQPQLAPVGPALAVQDVIFCSRAKTDSIATLSPHAPTRPIDPVRP
jgi:hypothetical protein